MFENVPTMSWIQSTEISGELLFSQLLDSFLELYIYIYISNRKNVDNLYHLYLSIYMRQNTRLDLCHMRCQPLFHEKKLKRAINSA